MAGHDTDKRSPAPDGRPPIEQPPWRRDYPIDAAEAEYVARRDFTKFLGLTSLAFVVGQLWIGVQSWLRGRREPPPVRPIAGLDEVPVGAVRMFHYPGPHDPCLLLRPTKDTLVAFHQKCTHLSCAVVPDMERSCLHCPCHHGVFDLASGRPIAGPPRRPLSIIQLEVRDGTVCATGVEMRTV